MKTRKQKVIRFGSIIVSIFLLASFFALPVTAEVDNLSSVTVENDFDFTIPDNIYEPNRRLNGPLFVGSFSSNLLSIYDDISLRSTFFDQTDAGYYDDQSGVFWYRDGAPVNESGSTLKAVLYINQLFDDDVTRTFRKGDTMFIGSEGWIGTWFESDTSFIDYRFTLRNGGDDWTFLADTVVAYTDLVSLDNDDVVQDLGFDYSSLTFEFSQEVTSNNLCLCLEFTISNDDPDLIFYIDPVEILITFGSGVSPNYPIFPAAPGGNDIGHLDSQEQQLIKDSQAGLNAGVGVMQNTGSLITDLESDLNLVAFTGAFNQIMNRLVLIPGLNPLVSISLSLGLFASLFGLAGSIISAASRGSGDASRQSLRESRKK